MVVSRALRANYDHRPGARRGSNETISRGREVGRKRIAAIKASDQQRGSFMAIILNAIYREFLRSSLSGMRKIAAG
jgi:hypothetical protein